jgi:hypothetical protein
MVTDDDPVSIVRRRLHTGKGGTTFYSAGALDEILQDENTYYLGEASSLRLFEEKGISVDKGIFCKGDMNIIVEKCEFKDKPSYKPTYTINGSIEGRDISKGTLRGYR